MSTHAPDILLAYPPGSLCIWRKSRFGSRRKKHAAKKYHMEYALNYSYVLARVVGKNNRAGNGRLIIDVLYTQKNPFGEMVLYVRRMRCVGAKNIMTLDEWRRRRPSPSAPAQRAGQSD